MHIGIDISQIAHEGTGVAQYVRALVSELVQKDQHNTYVLFGASLRKQGVFHRFFAGLNTSHGKVRLVVVPIPPTIMAIVWNRLHWAPIEWFIGAIDVFWSSDWTQPPLAHARGVTTIHDVSFLKFPDSFAESIISEQKRRLYWAQRVCEKFLCDSESTKRDVQTLLGIAPAKLEVIYPGGNTL